MKKLVYIANIRIPTEKAHGIQIMKMCESFARTGVEVELLVPWRNNPLRDDPFEYYRVQRIFSIRKIFSLDLVFLGRIGFWIQSFSFAVATFFTALFSYKHDAIFYSRDEMPIALLAFIGRKVAWEAHMGRNNIFSDYLISKKVPIITISAGLKEKYVQDGARGEILVAPDAVDVAQFQVAKGKDEARKELGLIAENDADKKIVLYAGHLYEWKGAHTLALAAAELDSNTEVFFVGGTDDDIARFRKEYAAERVRILGRKPHHEIPLYLKAADVLVIPNSAKENISKLYTSPMKLFEYMASGTPIIASDLPSLREILNEKNALFFVPDDAHSLAEAIKKALSDTNENKEFLKNLQTQQSSDILKYSWEKRAETIISFIQHA